MGIFKVEPQKRGPRGAGRTKIYKPLQLPEDVISDLKLYQDAYSILLATEKDASGNPVPVRFTMEQMLNRWMEQVKRFDRGVYRYVQDAKEIRANNPIAPKSPVDPTVGSVWDLRYLVERDGDEYYLDADDKLCFVAEIDGERVGVEQLINEEWNLMNETGIELSMEQAKVISKKILEHLNQKNQ